MQQQKLLKEVNPETPRTKKACEVLGINPNDLIKKSLDEFYKHGQHPDIARLRYQYHLKIFNREVEKV